MIDWLTIKDIIRKNENETSKEIHDDIIGCQCMVTPDYYDGKRLFIKVNNSNSNRVRNICTSLILSIDREDEEIRVDTENSTYVFTN